jgi:hypothetical protein
MDDLVGAQYHHRRLAAVADAVVKRHRLPGSAAMGSGGGVEVPSATAELALDCRCEVGEGLFWDADDQKVRLNMEGYGRPTSLRAMRPSLGAPTPGGSRCQDIYVSQAVPRESMNYRRGTRL